MMSSRKTMPIRAPRDIMFRLRNKLPGVNDADLIRVTFNTSLMRAETALDRIDKKLAKNMKKNVKKGF